METSKKHSSVNNEPASVSPKAKVSSVREYGESLVGSRLRVWWPIDRQFYKGVVDSYDSSLEKHRILYDDGDIETLDMNKERWEFIDEDDAEADEISLQDKSADEISDATPEPLNRKRAKSNGESSEKGRKNDVVPIRRTSTRSKTKASFGQRVGRRKKLVSSVKIAEKSKDDEKQTPKHETGRKGKMGDIGGKIVAAASRMSGRFQRKVNGLEKETSKSVESSKKNSASKNRKQKRPSFSSEAVSGKGKKPRTSSRKMKTRDTTNEDGDDEDGEDEYTSDDESTPLEKISESNKRKQKGTSSSSEEVSEKVGEDVDDDDDTSDDDSKPLVSLLKKTPEVMEALMEKLKRKKEKEAGEGSSGNKAEAEAEAEGKAEAEAKVVAEEEADAEEEEETVEES